MGKIGVGIVTCNRQDFYEKCLESLSKCDIDELVTVNDGSPYDTQQIVGEYKQHKQNKGVGITKNEILQYLLDADCEHLFIIEDDIIVSDVDVFQKYITTAERTGIWHLMFGYHGPANKTPDRKPNPRLIVDYGDECKLALNQHCVGAFCYYHKGVIKNVGLMDEAFKNAWEHVEHSYQIAKLGLVPGYWWWPDVANSYDYLDELACSEDNSTIRWADAEKKIPKQDWSENIQKGMHHFYSKHNFMPGTVPDTSPEDIRSKLGTIQKNYSKKAHV